MLIGVYLQKKGIVLLFCWSDNPINSIISCSEVKLARLNKQKDSFQTCQLSYFWKLL